MSNDRNNASRSTVLIVRERADDSDGYTDGPLKEEYIRQIAKKPLAVATLQKLGHWPAGPMTQRLRNTNQEILALVQALCGFHHSFSNIIVWPTRMFLAWLGTTETIPHTEPEEYPHTIQFDAAERPSRASIALIYYNVNNPLSMRTNEGNEEVHEQLTEHIIQDLHRLQQEHCIPIMPPPDNQSIAGIPNLMVHARAGTRHNNIICTIPFIIQHAQKERIWYKSYTDHIDSQQQQGRNESKEEDEPEPRKGLNKEDERKVRALIAEHAAIDREEKARDYQRGVRLEQLETEA